jgi:hypothetical protein
MRSGHLHLAAPPREVPIREACWWEATEYLALTEVRRAMAGGAAPASAAVTPEESARHAVFWTLFETEHLIRRFAVRLAAGERLRMRSGIYRHRDGRVDFNLRIVQQAEVALQSSRGAR